MPARTRQAACSRKRTPSPPHHLLEGSRMGKKPPAFSTHPSHNPVMRAGPECAAFGASKPTRCRGALPPLSCPSPSLPARCLAAAAAASAAAVAASRAIRARDTGWPSASSAYRRPVGDHSKKQWSDADRTHHSGQSSLSCPPSHLQLACSRPGLLHSQGRIENLDSIGVQRHAIPHPLPQLLLHRGSE